jgi:hypothetical protein
MTTLASLKEALSQPFAVEYVQFLPTAIQQNQDQQWTCLALPYANKRVYEDRLNTIAFGEWRTPPTSPYTVGTKLIVPVTVIVCDVTHTDYGEAYLSVPSRYGGQRGDEHSATEAYSQAFRRACSKFLLGRYLYDLRKLRLPYDVQTKRIAITEAEHIAWVEKLYQEARLLPRSYAFTPSMTAERSILSTEHPAQTAPAIALPAGPAPEHEQEPSSQPASMCTQEAKPRASASDASSDQVDAGSQIPTHYPGNLFLDWVARQVNRDSHLITRICAYYQVQQLCQLTQVQRADLTQRLKAQQTKQTSMLASSGSSPVPQGVSS